MIGRMPRARLRARLSSFSIEVPVRLPASERVPKTRSAVCTEIGSGAAPTTILQAKVAQAADALDSDQRAGAGLDLPQGAVGRQTRGGRGPDSVPTGRRQEGVATAAGPWSVRQAGRGRVGCVR
jgi:hypothetical protein